MKSFAVNRLTRTYLEGLARSNYVATAVAVLIITLSVLWMFFRIGGQGVTVIFSVVAYAVAAFLGMLWAFRMVYLARYGPVRLGRQHQLAWLLVGLGLAANACASVLFGVLAMLGRSGFPTLADLLLNLFYPLVFMGLLLMPAAVRFRGRMGLDALISMLSFLGVSWFFVIGPTYFAHVGDADAQSQILRLLVALVYPCWDVLLILAIALLFQRRIERTLHASLLLFGVAILANIWADLAFLYTNMFHHYQLGSPFIDPFWFASYLLIGLSGLYQYADLARREYVDIVRRPQGVSAAEHTPFKMLDLSGGRIWRRISAVLIHLPLTVLLLLTVYGELIYNNVTSHSLVVLTAVVGILVATRYYLAMHENNELLLERERRHEQSEHLRHMMTQLTSILDEEHLRERIIEMAIDELDFDAVMLLLLDERHAPNQGPQLLVYPATTSGAQMQRHSFLGTNLLQQIALDGKAREVHWTTQSQVPPEIHLWCQEQHIPGMIFLPLTYQGHVLGSLGVTRRDGERLNAEDVAPVIAYTEQVTTIIEHARFYKEAREHEAFSRAMATIATRLNAAVIEPAEIGLVICKEGAEVLHADYTLFYAVDEENSLLSPLAVYMHDLDKSLPVSEWPSLHTSEQDAQALYSLQPLLLTIAPQQASPAQASSLPSVSGRMRITSSKLPALREQARQLSLRARLAQYHIQTAILAPVISNGEPVGLLLFARTRPPGVSEKQPLTIEDLSPAQDFVEQVAVAFTTAQIYEDLQMAHQRLQELDQLKDQFMMTASHELRTPLTAVQGYIELLAQFDEQLPVEQRQEFLQKARRGCEELALLLGNVMDASRLEVEAGIKPALLTRVSVQEVIESVLVLIEPQLTQEQREVYSRIPAHLSVQADAVRLRQVLMNISVNALKYSPPRTRIGFSARPVAEPQGLCVVISVSDKGKGITPQDQALLFQRFVRLERDINSPVRGSGLGLYISRRLIEAMGGKIWIESSGVPGEGTTFHILLPAGRK